MLSNLMVQDSNHGPRLEMADLMTLVNLMTEPMYLFYWWERVCNSHIYTVCFGKTISGKNGVGLCRILLAL